MENDNRQAIVALIGKTNAGKSTLINQIAKKNLVITSRKPQTTRVRTLLKIQQNNIPITFVDTPGFSPFLYKSNVPLNKIYKKELNIAIDQANFLIIMINGSYAELSNIKVLFEKIIQTHNTAKSKIIAVINKIDKIDSAKLSHLTKEIQTELGIDTIIPISALHNVAVNELLQYIEKNVQPASEEDHYYITDEETEVSDEFTANEITRQSILHHLHEDIPYKIAVITEQWKEKKDSITIHQNICITENKHKKIILGKSGQLIKLIGQMARYNMQDVLHKKIHLFLFVKHDPNWLQSPDLYVYDQKSHHNIINKK